MFKRTTCSSTFALLTVGTLLLGVLRAVEAAELDGCTPSTLDGFDCAASFQFQGGLPDDGRTFTVHWATYEAGEPLQMAMQAQTDGYIALGFPKWPDSMFGAASVIGYVDDTGVAVVQPYLLQGYSQSDVVVDSSALALADTGGEEVEVSVDGGQTSPMTVISFSLEQLPEGVDPATAPVDIIFAVGDSDEVSYHGPFNKGSGVIDVLSAPSIADAAPEAAPEEAPEAAPEAEEASAPESASPPREGEMDDVGAAPEAGDAGDQAPSIARSRGLLTTSSLSMPSGESFAVSWALEAGDRVRFGMQTDTVGGWVGIGFPSKPGAMPGAMSVIGWIDGDDASVRAYALDGYSSSDIRPLDAASGAFAISETYAETSMGRTYIEFVTSLDSVGVDAGGTNGSGGRRSLASEDEDTPAAMPLDIIFAAGPVPGLVYHTSQRRGAAQIDLASGSAKAERTVPGGTPQQRYDHGVLMWTAWGAVLPFGIGIGKLIRPTKSKAVLYAHIFCQLSGLAIATAGLAIATVNFRGLTDTPFSHGQLGVAVMALLYYQFLNGLLRPHAIDDYSERSFWTTARRVWEHVHSLLGFATLALAAVNCVLGIIILSDRFLEVDFSDWFGGFSATIICVMLTVAFIGRYYAALQDERIFDLSAGNHRCAEGNGRDHGVVESPSETDEAYKKV